MGRSRSAPPKSTSCIPSARNALRSRSAPAASNYMIPCVNTHVNYRKIVQNRVGNLLCKAPPPHRPYRLLDPQPAQRTVAIFYAISGCPVPDGPTNMLIIYNFLHRILDVQKTIEGALDQRILMICPGDGRRLWPTEHVASILAAAKTKKLCIAVCDHNEEF